jgi:hypothetical protein
VNDKVEPAASGQGMLDMRRAIEDAHGKDVIVRALANVSPEARKEYETASPLSWVKITTAHDVHAAIARELGRDVDEFTDEFVVKGVERSFKTVWRVLLSLTSDEALVKRAASMYSRTRNVGTMKNVIIEKGGSRGALEGWPDINERAMRTIALGIQTVLRLAGRKDAVTTYTKTATGAEFTSRW